MAERIVLPRGTVEHIPVDIADRLQNLTSLDGTAARYDIRAHGSTSWVVQSQSATTIGMTVYCLVDTTTPAYATSGRYELFVQFDNLPEHPRLGPFDFEVNV